MNEVLILIYDSFDVIVALVLGVWLIATKGKLTNKSKPMHSLPLKWTYRGGYFAIFYGVVKGLSLLI